MTGSPDADAPTRDYSLRYHDRFGTVRTTCRSNGKELEFSLRGRAFRGPGFWGLDIDGSAMGDLPGDSFPVSRHGDLEAEFSLTLSVPLVGGTEPTSGLLTLVFDYRDDFFMTGQMTVGGTTYEIKTTRRWRNAVESVITDAERVLIELQKLVSSAGFLKCCQSCRWSYFQPGGGPEFGVIACFVEHKKEAGAVSGKHDLFRIWRDGAPTQETWSCCQRRVNFDPLSSSES